MKTRMLLIALLVLSLSLFAWASAEEPAGETDAAPAEEAGAAPEEAADPAADAESEAEAEPAPPEPAELAGEWVCTLDLGFWTETAALTLNEDMTCTLVTGNPDRVTESLEGTWSLAGNVLSLNGTEVGTVALSGHTLTVAQAGGENVLTFSRAEIQVLTADDVVGAWEILSDTDPDSTLVFAADGSCVYTEFSAEFPTTWSLEDGVFTFNNQTVRAEMNGENLILSNETTRTVLRRIELPAEAARAARAEDLLGIWTVTFDNNVFEDWTAVFAADGSLSLTTSGITIKLYTWGEDEDGLYYMAEENTREAITLEEDRALTAILGQPVTLTRPETDAADTLVDESVTFSVIGPEGAEEAGEPAPEE